MDKDTFVLEFEKPLRDLKAQMEALKQSSKDSQFDVSEEISGMEKKLEDTKREIYQNLSPWQKVQLARHPKRPYSLDYVSEVFDDFQELHGDRLYRDDQAILGGIARLDGQPIMLIMQQKGRDTKDNILRNFGCPDPEGYRKAMRLMRMAEKFSMPVITFVDTPGAYPGIGSEERHVAEAIAVNIRDMSDLQVPIVTAIIGEGGSGGALGIATSDVILILENAYYSVISPEGCAAILWKDRAYAEDAANALKITAEKLLELGIVDEIISEPVGGAHIDYAQTASNIKSAIQKHLKKLLKLKTETLLSKRYSKFRGMGVFEE